MTRVTTVLALMAFIVFSALGSLQAQQRDTAASGAASGSAAQLLRQQQQQRDTAASNAAQRERLLLVQQLRLLESANRLEEAALRRQIAELEARLGAAVSGDTSVVARERMMQELALLRLQTTDRVRDMRERRPESDAERLSRAAESERLARIRVELGTMTEQEYSRVKRELELVDSAVVARAAGLYRARAMSRRDFENSVGILRADSIIRATQDTSAGRATIYADRIEMQIDAARRMALSSADSAGSMRRAAEIVRARIDAMGTPLPELSLGVGLSCTQCSITTSHDGRTVWTFSTFPTVGRVEPGSIAARLGLQTGDTLKTIDDIPVNTAAGGERLAALVPGTTVKLGWSRAGATQSASVAIPPDTARSSGDAIRLSQTVGNVRVEVRGRQATWTRDPRTGALVITGDSIRVTVIPPDP